MKVFERGLSELCDLRKDTEKRTIHQKTKYQRGSKLGSITWPSGLSKNLNECNQKTFFRLMYYREYWSRSNVSYLVVSQCPAGVDCKPMSRKSEMVFLAPSVRFG